jgi:hypothetical protein
MVGRWIRKQSFIHQHLLSIASTRERPGRVNPRQLPQGVGLGVQARRPRWFAVPRSAAHRHRSLVRAGVRERVAIAISGHRTRAVFEPYNIVSQRDLQHAARKLEGYLAAQNVVNSGKSARSKKEKRSQNRV